MATNNFPKWLKITLIVIGSLVVIIAIGLFIVGRNAGSIADGIIHDKFNKTEMSKMYRLNWDEITVRPFTGTLIIRRLVFEPDSSAYEAPDSIKRQFPTLYSITIPRLVVKGFDLKSGLDLDKIALETVRIVKPHVRIIDYLSKEEKQKFSQADARQQNSLPDTTGKKPTTQQVNIGAFRLEAGDFEYYDHRNQKIIFNAATINMAADSLRLRTQDLMKVLTDRNFKQASLELNGLEYKFPNGFYDAKLDSFKWDLNEELITLEGAHLIPQYDTMEFGKKFGRQTDRMDLKLPYIALHQPDLNRLLNDGGISLPLIEIEDADLWLFRDKNVQLDRSRFPKLPNQALAALDRYVKIDKIEIKNSSILYNEMAEDATKPGTVPVKQFYASLYQVTNDKQAIKNGGPMKWDLRGQVFLQPTLVIDVTFPADLSAADFSFDGHMDAMDMTHFNTITVTNENIKIEEGHINKARFEVKAQQDYSTGTMWLNYDNLHLTLLKTSAKAGNKELGLISSLANIVIRSFNPSKNSNKPADPADIFFERDKNKSIFNYIFKSLIAGIKSTVLPGISMTKEKYDRQHDRQDRKDDRQKRREKRRKNR